MKPLSAAHVQRVLKLERELGQSYLFSPCKDDQERAQLRHDLAALDRARAERQRELPLAAAA